MPLSVIDGFPSAGDLERVLVLELDFNATASQAQHEPGVLRGLCVQHDPLRVKCTEVKLCGKPCSQKQKDS